MYATTLPAAPSLATNSLRAPMPDRLARRRAVAPSGVALPADVRWPWACRALDRTGLRLIPDDGAAPSVGDLVVVEVVRVRNHTGLVAATNERLRLYEGTRFVGVLGHRYATDAFEAEFDATPLAERDTLHLVTNGGMVSVVQSRAAGVKAPTELRFLGYVATPDGARINTKTRLAPPVGTLAPVSLPPVLLGVGSGMNAGKTTSVVRMVQALVRRGVRVAVCKVTGSVSHRDLFEMQATGACFARDFSDYGYPSTYLASEDEIRALFRRMMADAAQTAPDVIVVEIADGVLQRETAWLLADDEVRTATAGVVLATGCALSAIAGLVEVESYGHEVVAVTGCLTSAPLFVREFASRRPDVTVASSAGDRS
ncbi:MAG: hypothetical protein AAFQ53_13420, partial [Bacteroidota bacterium]